MRTRMTPVVVIVSGLVLLSVLAWVGGQAAPAETPLQALIGSAFTYQGYLEDGGVPAEGSYDFHFSLWDASTSGSDTQYGSTVVRNGVSVVDGVFMVSLDFGSVFDGTALWLEIEVQGPGDLGYTLLTPRQALTPVPHAINADKLDGLESSAFASFMHNHLGQTWDTVIHTDGLNVGSYVTSGRGIVGRALSSTGSSYGVYGEAQSVSGAGVYGVNNGSPGPLAFGVLGISNADDGQGVHGEGRVGVSGWSFVSPGAGVVGASYAATGTTSGVSGYTDSETGRGIFGNAEHTSGTNYGVVGQSDSTNGYDFYANGVGSDFGPFTGAHEVKLAGSFAPEVTAGLIVSATGEAQKRSLPGGGVGLSSTLPTVTLADEPEDKAVLGVLVAESKLPDDHWYTPQAGERFATVNALGEGRVWVSTATGRIEAGDYITNSSIPGYGQRQSDDVLHNYTLAKAIETVDWNAVTETVEFAGQTYKVYLLAVVYISG